MARLKRCLVRLIVGVQVEVLEDVHLRDRFLLSGPFTRELKTLLDTGLKAPYDHLQV